MPSGPQKYIQVFQRFNNLAVKSAYSYIPSMCVKVQYFHYLFLCQLLLYIVTVYYIASCALTIILKKSH